MEFRPVAKGYYLEALSVDDDAVWFSDVARGGIRRVSPDGRTDEWLAEQRWIAGILQNEDGRVLYSRPGGIAWLDPRTGDSGTLLDAIEGKAIGGIHEMAPDRTGGLFFGTVDIPAIERGETPRPVGLYRLDPSGRVSRLCEGLTFTNGLAISADGRRLYHNESFVGVCAYDVAPDGALSGATR